MTPAEFEWLLEEAAAQGDWKKVAALGEEQNGRETCTNSPSSAEPVTTKQKDSSSSDEKE